MGVPEINYWTAMIALFLGVPMAGVVVAVGLFLQTVIRGRSGKLWRNDELVIVEKETTP